LLFYSEKQRMLSLLFCCLRFQESSDSAADLGPLAVFSLQITAKTAAALAAPPPA